MKAEDSQELWESLKSYEWISADGMFTCKNIDNNTIVYVLYDAERQIVMTHAEEGEVNKDIFKNRQ